MITIEAPRLHPTKERRQCCAGIVAFGREATLLVLFWLRQGLTQGEVDKCTLFVEALKDLRDARALEALGDVLLAAGAIASNLPLATLAKEAIVATIEAASPEIATPDMQAFGRRIPSAVVYREYQYDIERPSTGISIAGTLCAALVPTWRNATPISRSAALQTRVSICERRTKRRTAAFTPGGCPPRQNCPEWPH
jgi:hypothetical protein